MVRAGRNENRPITCLPSHKAGKTGLNLLVLPKMASTRAYELHSEARGSHWIAWVTRDGDPKPQGAVVLVGQTQDQALANARLWAEKTT